MFDLGQIAGIVAIVAFLPYILSILKGKTRPNKATWWVWTMIGGLVLLSYYSVGANSTLWVPIALFVGMFATAVLSLKYGESGWSKLDLYCLGGGAVGIILWIIFSEPLLALVASMFVSFVGALPTIKKTYIDPVGENRLAWILFSTADIINLFAVEQWAFAIAIYPICLFIIDGTITALALRTKKDEH